MSSNQLATIIFSIIFGMLFGFSAARRADDKTKLGDENHE